MKDCQKSFKYRAFCEIYLLTESNISKGYHPDNNLTPESELLGNISCKNNKFHTLPTYAR